MGDLSKHFSRSEFACPCGCGFQTIDIELISILEEAAGSFYDQGARAGLKLKRIAIVINSGTRCIRYNAKLRKELGLKRLKKASQHTRACAVDARYQHVFGNGRRKDIDADKVADYFEKKYPDQHGIGRYLGRTHIDTRGFKARWDNR